MALFNKKKKDNVSTKETVVEEKAPVYAKGSTGDVKTYSVEDSTAAMIMAIVADQVDIPLNQLRFISIKEVIE